ncbi:MAG: protein TolQ [Deltaproteobacteria bacterium]|nr:protein TolQ [Deltaproteobacteria bacterium]
MEPLETLQDHSILSMVTGSGPVVQAVLITLIILSVWSWAITIQKFLQFRKARSDSNEFSSIFWETRNFARVDDSSRRLEASPLTKVFASGYRELSHIIQDRQSQGAPKAAGNLDLELATVEHALKRAEQAETGKLERGITFLASVASAAPFIGLFGTVWGIMNAFHGLSTLKSTTLQAVAPGISEALVATAIGLAAAIPAAVAYNYFVVAVKGFRQSMDAFSEEFLDIARQHFSR